VKRNRLLYFLFVVFTLLSGLASRHFAALLPQWVNIYLGDALWSLMVFLMFGLIFRFRQSWWIAIATLVFSYSIEISQLYHAAWIAAIRATRIGGLVLGFGFLCSDMLSKLCFGYSGWIWN
jgi:hypothetical protein